jgi:hypothetical protein
MKTMHMHHGTAMLRVSNGGCLVGDYYAGDRRTFGRIYCRRQLRSPQADAESVYTARTKGHWKNVGQLVATN